MPAAHPASPARNAHADVLITGGGLIGQTLAVALAAHGLSSIVVDPASPVTQLAPDFDGRASAIASASMAMLGAIGLGDALDGHGCPIERIWVSDGLQPGELDFAPPAGDGPLGVMFENRRLRLALSAMIAATPLIDLRAPARSASVQHDAAGARITLADGSIVTAPLLAVCEGRNSPTREAAGISSAHWGYRHGAMVGAIAHERPHDNTAYEIFYPDGPFAILPLPDLPAGDMSAPWPHRSGFVWSTGEDDAPIFARLGPRGFKAEMLKRMGHILGDIQEIAPRGLYPLSFQHAARITATRMVLVGDAAHGIHPIAGQGFNLGLRDVATLVEVLVDGARLGLDLGDAQLLERYERWRGLDNLSVAAATDGLTRLFGLPGRAASAARRFGLAGVQKSRLAKRFFMAEARGQSGDQPKLLAGLTV
ncbi:MAG: FAD-dependent monooxygenase [Proteobacteria bacterium]|nr:FAD-dependent monooxygenase [Pseudomonadota bacterium]